MWFLFGLQTGTGDVNHGILQKDGVGHRALWEICFNHTARSQDIFPTAASILNIPFKDFLLKEARWCWCLSQPFNA